MIRFRKTRFALGTALALVLAQALAHGGATGIVLERHNLMTDIRDANKAISAMVRGKQPLVRAELERHASTIAELGPKMAPLFPDSKASRHGAGSNVRQSLWGEFAKFEELGESMTAAAAELAAAAPAAPEDELRARARDVAQSCKSCHKSYRLKRKKH